VVDLDCPRIWRWGLAFSMMMVVHVLQELVPGTRKTGHVVVIW